MYGYNRPEIEIQNGKLIRCVTLGKEVEIPDGITEIGDLAFRLCPNVQFLRIPDSVMKLGEAPFHGCRNLTGIHIPDHLLEGMEMGTLVTLFAENPVNYPSQEWRLMTLFLEGTGDFNDAFRKVLVKRLIHPFHARRWLRLSIEEDKAQWTQMILSHHESMPCSVMDECINRATELQRAQVLAVLINYTQTHLVTDQKLELEEW